MQNVDGETPLMLSDKHHHESVSSMIAYAMIARYEARRCNSDFFRSIIVADAPLAPRQWISLLHPDGQNTLYLWTKASIADESACFSAFFAGHSHDVPLRRLPGDVIRRITPYLVHSTSLRRQALHKMAQMLDSVTNKKRMRC
jgi:hypothetical protein